MSEPLLNPDISPDSNPDSTSNPAGKPGKIKIGGLSRAAQKLQAAQEKFAAARTGAKPPSTANTASWKAKSAFAGTKKTPFQRKAT